METTYCIICEEHEARHPLAVEDYIFGTVSACEDCHNNFDPQAYYEFQN